MADKTIGELPVAEELYNDSLLVVEQQREARSIRGELVANFAREAAAADVQRAVDAAASAEKSADSAKTDADRAEEMRQSIELDYEYIDTARTEAQASAQAAGESQEKAKASEDAAKASQTAAKNSQTAAAGSATAAGTSASNASTSASDAAKSAAAAKTSQDAAKASETAAGASAAAAKNSETASGSSATAAKNSETAAKASQTTAENFAVGETDSAKYYYDQAKRIAQGLEGGLLPMGTVTFAQLAGQSKQAGYMYNISDAFTTDATFREGVGHAYPAGTNVYWTAEGNWDCLAGYQVVSVNGQTGAVNITSVTGNAGTATKLATPRQLGVNLARTAASTFDGSANQLEIPVKGVLPVANGGTGNSTGKAPTAGAADTATKLAASKTIGISGAVTGTATAFDGSQAITIPTTGIDVSKANAGVLAVTRGGTGKTTALTASDVGALPLAGGKITGQLDVGDNVSISTSADHDGNITIRWSPSTAETQVWQIDAYTGNLRFYTYTDGEYKFPLTLYPDGRVGIGDKVKIETSGADGGCVRITSADGATTWTMDAYNGNLRFYAIVDGKVVTPLTLFRDGTTNISRPPTVYNANGQIITSTDGVVKGVGHATMIVHANGFAEIHFTARITTAGTNAKLITWGLSRNALHSLGNAPFITPVAGGNIMLLNASGAPVTDAIGFGCTADSTGDESINRFWNPSRVYLENGSMGNWGDNILPLGGYMTGTVFGTVRYEGDPPN